MGVAALDQSRRDLIKKATVVGGIVWATPVIQSMTTAASAAGTPGPGCSDVGCARIPCNPPNADCGAYDRVGGCFCATGPTGACESVFFPSPDCADYAACGPAPGYACATGFRCVTPCCCQLGFPPFCAPECTVDMQKARKAVGASMPPGFSAH
jgi:hypothetical protein